MLTDDVVFKSFPYDAVCCFVKFPMFTIYAHPVDYPDKYVARIFDLDHPTNMIALADSYESILKAIPTDRTINWGRTPIDDPHIVETWF